VTEEAGGGACRGDLTGLCLADWTADRIDAECREAYAAYFDQVRRRHVAYFAARPEQRSETWAFVARTRQAAFPDGWEHLAGAIAARAWHRHHLSAGSSQVLAIALLAAASRADSSLQWLPGERRSRHPHALFEVELAPGVLRERPRQTSIDWLVLDRVNVIAAEAKFTERGLGRCSCERRAVGLCSERVLERPYWGVASTDMGLQREATPGRCSLSLAYQAVRNVAAAQSIAAGRRSTTFILLYDARNPYFAGARAWPGWVRMLWQLMAHSRTTFASLAWQELLARVNLDQRVECWAADKHGLGPEKSDV
jgi:Restriction Endonuclease associating with ARP